MLFRFANPDYLWLLVLVPVLTVVYIFYTRHKRRQLALFGEEELMPELIPLASRIRPHVKFSLQLLAFTLLVVAVARPQYGTKEQTVKRQGIEVMIALDISNSMLAEDVAPNRLDKAKQMLSKLVDQMTDDKLGLVVFAGEAFVQLPITCDYVSAKMFLNNISPDLIMAQGTAIGAALRTCVQSFGSDEGKASRAIILITDGENHEDNAKAAAEAAKEKGIRIYVVGIGRPDGAPIPDGRGGFRKDKSGQVVVSRLNEDMCREIASAGNGIYLRADNTNTARRALQNELDKLGKTEIETTVFTDYNEQYQSFVLIALLLLMIDFFVLSRKNQRLGRLDIFGERK